MSIPQAAALQSIATKRINSQYATLQIYDLAKVQQQKAIDIQSVDFSEHITGRFFE